MESVLALARTDGFGVCCSHLISMLQILNEVFTEPFVLQSAAPHIRGQLGAVHDMPIWHPSTAIYPEIGFPLPLALYWIEAVNVGILPSGVQLRKVLKSQSSELSGNPENAWARSLALGNKYGGACWNARSFSEHVGAMVHRLLTLGRTLSSSISLTSSHSTHIYWECTMLLIFNSTDID